MFNILFVDDDDAIGYIVSKFSCWKNSEFVLKKIVNNAEDALKSIETQAYDLIITDIRMPIMDGLEFIKELRGRNIETAVILSSTYSDFQYAKEGMRLGALDYISKPLTENKLVEELEYIGNYLREKKSREQGAITDSENRKLEEVFQGILQNSTDLEQRIDEMLDEARKNSADNLKSESLKLQLNTADSRIYQICKLLFLHIEEPKVVDVISGQMELNKEYISVLFKNAANIGLNKYITMMKMEYAKVLLRNSNLKIYEISEKCGYTTIDYFSQLFKKHTGNTPIQYRKNG